MKTFVDAGVLIQAARGSDELARRAFQILDDPEREFVGSTYVQLETIPKARYNGYDSEARFYREFFAECSEWVESSPPLSAAALEEATNCGLSACDALHVAAAAAVGADDLVTTEKPEKPLYRTRLVAIHYVGGEA